MNTSRDTPSQPMTAAQALEEMREALQLILDEWANDNSISDDAWERGERALATQVSEAQPDAEAAWHEWRTANPDATMYEAFKYAAALPARAQVPEGWKLVRVEILESAANLMEYGRCVTRDDDAASKFAFFRDQLRLAAAPTEEEKP